MSEVWKPVIGWEDCYQVSNLGRVKSEYQILKPKKGNQPYYSVSLSREGKVDFRRIHRLVAQAFVPNPEGKGVVDHIDNNKLNNMVDNLQWMTVKENTSKAFSEGRMPTGEQVLGSKLTKVKVLEIKALYNLGDITQALLGEQFGVSRQQISKIVNNKQWRHI